MGSIIERPLSNGEVSHQAMVKIPGSKAAVKTFKDRASAQEFIDEIERGLKIATLIRHKRDKASIHNAGQSREEAANAREEQWRNKWLKETLRGYKQAAVVGKMAGKKAKEEELIVLAHAGVSTLLTKILNIAKVIDYQCSGTKQAPPALIEAAIEKALFSTLSETGDRYYIDNVKSKSDEALTIMQACVNLACGRAESVLEKQEIAAAISENDQAVDVPRERVRL